MRLHAVITNFDIGSPSRVVLILTLSAIQLPRELQAPGASKQGHKSSEPKFSQGPKARVLSACYL